MKRNSRPSLPRRSTTHVASRSQAPSHPFDPARPGSSLSQNVPESSRSNVPSRKNTALNSPARTPSSRPTPTAR